MPLYSGIPTYQEFVGDMKLNTGLTFVLSCFLEIALVFGTGILLFENSLDGGVAEGTWYLYLGLIIPVMPMNMGLSLYNSPTLSKAIGCYFKMDHITPTLWSLALSFGFMLLYKPKKPILKVQIGVVILHWLTNWTLFSNLRSNIKYLPWTVHTAGLYRFVRYICILIVVIFQVLEQSHATLSVAYFVTLLGFNTGLLLLVHMEAYIPTRAKRKAKIAAAKAAAESAGGTTDDGIPLKERDSMTVPLMSAEDGTTRERIISKA